MRARTRLAAEDGWGEWVIILLFAAVIGFAFLWALELHDKEPDDRGAVATTIDPTASTLTPPSLPPPRKYKVTDGVNVRQGPATNTVLLGRIELGNTVVVECRVEGQNITSSDGSSNQWLRIQFDGAQAYVSAVYVNVGGDLDDPNKIAHCSFGA